MGRKTTVLATACIIIAVVLFFELFMFGNWMQSSGKAAASGDPYFNAYQSEFNSSSPPTTPSNYSFSPPVSMYHALQIALQSGGWNANSLKNMTISAQLDYCAFGSNSFLEISPVASPPADWSPQQVNGTTYRYVWTIIVEGPGPAHGIPPPGYYLVDAATAELLTIPILA